jgi:hypothetical protein
MQVVLSHEQDPDAAVHHLADEAGQENASSQPSLLPQHLHGRRPGTTGAGGSRRPSPNNNTSSSGDTASSSEWPPLQQQHCYGVGGGILRMMVPRPGPAAAAPPPSLEMSLGRQGWQMEHQRVGVEFESASSPAAAAGNELTMLKCL